MRQRDSVSEAEIDGERDVYRGMKGGESALYLFLSLSCQKWLPRASQKEWDAKAG